MVSMTNIDCAQYRYHRALIKYQCNNGNRKQFARKRQQSTLAVNIDGNVDV